MSIAQIDQALRDFDTAHLRRDVETASQGGSRREPRGAPQMFSDLVRQMESGDLISIEIRRTWHRSTARNMPPTAERKLFARYQM